MHNNRKFYTCITEQSQALRFPTGRGAAGHHGEWVGGSVRFGGEAGHDGRSRADLSQQAAHPLSGLFPQAADTLRGLLEEVRH